MVHSLRIKYFSLWKCIKKNLVYLNRFVSVLCLFVCFVWGFLGFVCFVVCCCCCFLGEGGLSSRILLELVLDRFLNNIRFSITNQSINANFSEFSCLCVDTHTHIYIYIYIVRIGARISSPVPHPIDDTGLPLYYISIFIM